MDGGGFGPRPRASSADDMDDSSIPDPWDGRLLAGADSYQGPAADGFESSRSGAVALFKSATKLDAGAPLDFGFLLGKGETTTASSAGSTKNDEDDPLPMSVDNGRKRVRSSTILSDSEDVLIVPPCPPTRPHRVPFGKVDGEDRGKNAMDPPISHIDPYFWMRDFTHEDEEVQQLLRDEDAYCNGTLAHLDTLREHIYSEMIGHTKEDDVDVPALDADGYAYYTRSFKDKPYRAHYRAKIIGDVLDNSSDGSPVPESVRPLAALVGVRLKNEELLLDENDFVIDGQGNKHPYMSLQGPSLSHDNVLVAYSVDFKGDDCYTTKFARLGDVKGKQGPADVIDSTNGSMEWDATGHAGLYYVGLDAELRSAIVFHHTLGAPRSLDTTLLDERDPEFSVSIKKTHDQKLLLVSSCSADTAEHHVVDLYATQQMICVSKRQFGHQYQVDHCAGMLYVLTNKDGAANMKLCRTSITSLVEGSGADTWQDVWAPGKQVRLTSLRCFANFVALEGREGGVRRIFVLHYSGLGASSPPPVQTVHFPEAQPHSGTLMTPRRQLASMSLYSVGFHTMRTFDSETMRLYRADYCCPSRIYSYHVPTNTFKLLKEEPAPGFDHSLYRAERITSQRRGVPISLVYRSDLHSAGLQGGPYPTLLTGYGCYGSCQDPDFDMCLLSLLDRGVLYAVAHVRGGGELGEEWREEGRQFKVKQRFLDFEDVAETLVALGVSEPSRLAAWGESSGGNLVAGTANLRPDLFKALLLEVPFVDVLNTMSDPKIPLTCGDWAEYGNTNERDAFQYVLEYSPYENIRMQEYPAMLCTASLNDSMVGFWEPLKYVTKLRRSKLDRNPVLLKVNFHAGHGHSSDRYHHMMEKAFHFAFLLDQLGISR